MQRLANSILNHKRLILCVILFLLLLSLFGMLFVNVNYNLSDYLPADAPSTQALETLEESFSSGIPNLTVYVPDITIAQALEYKSQFQSIDGVSNVLWLDDVVDIQTSLSMADPDTVEAWYKDGGALFLLTADSGQSVAITEAVQSITENTCVMSGEVANFNYIQTKSMKEISQIMIYVVPLVFLVLLFTTSAWFEPILFLITIFVAILLNEGSNVFLGQISFVTRSTSAILQLAISMDYAVFLLHSFSRHREEVGDIRTAMERAMVESFSAIASSMSTTVFGFAALMLMKFRIGPDMGLVLAKGVIISFLSVTIFLPILTIYTTKLLDKTKHRSFLPSFQGFARFVTKICIPLSAVLLCMIGPSFLAQHSNTFAYGSSSMNTEGAQITLDTALIKEKFDQKQQMVLLVPSGDTVKEAQLTRQMEAIPSITSVVSYDNAVGSQIPVEFLTEDQLSQLSSGGYSRILLYADTEEEGEEAFALVEKLRETAAQYYGDTYHLLGQNVVNYDLKSTITADNLVVNLAAILSIGVILLITFRSISLPIILLLTIEGAIWINLGLPYFMNSTLNFIGYQIISAVQLGATVDYGILFTQHYMANRQSLHKWDAVRAALATTTGSILTPAGIVAIAGLTLGFISTNGVISQLGAILGRGALISAGMVLVFLPALLILFDRLIEKTTLKSNFLPRSKRRGKDKNTTSALAADHSAATR